MHIHNWYIEIFFLFSLVCLAYLFTSFIMTRILYQNGEDSSKRHSVKFAYAEMWKHVLHRPPNGKARGGVQEACQTNF